MADGPTLKEIVLHDYFELSGPPEHVQGREAPSQCVSEVWGVFARALVVWFTNLCFGLQNV